MTRWRISSLAPLLFSALAGCSCLSVYSDNPTRNAADGQSVSIFADGKVIDVSPQGPTRVQGLNVWMNYEASGPISGTPAVIRINRKNVAGITYANEKGFKSSGKVNVTRFLTPGLNTVSIDIVYGVSPAGIKQSGSRMAEGIPSGAGRLVHACYESDAPGLSEGVTEFKIDYVPASRRKKT